MGTVQGVLSSWTGALQRSSHGSGTPGTRAMTRGCGQSAEVGARRVAGNTLPVRQGAFRPRGERPYAAGVDVRIAKCLLVSKVLAADGMMTENERAFLDGCMQKMGLSPTERRSVLDLEGWDDAEAAASSLSQEDRQALVSELVDAASADGRLSPLELATVNRIASALGVSAG